MKRAILALSIALAASCAHAQDPGFALIATAYTKDGPVLYVLANGIDGAACIAGITDGIGPYAEFIADGSIQPAGESHVPRGGTFAPKLADMIMSCERAW